MKTRSLATRCVLAGLSVALLGVTACGIEDDSSETDDPSVEDAAAQAVEVSATNDDAADLASQPPCISFAALGGLPVPPGPFPPPGANIYNVPIAANGNSFCSLRQGARNFGVWAMQNALSRCYGQDIISDTEFGPRTRAALVNAQRMMGASPDGEYGPQTRALMKFVRTDNADCNRVP
jgi:peptidoglycan hydrolase-like protein with peptidoglycan-binding domain